MARRDKRGEKDVARGRVERLVGLAESALLAGRVDRANRYAELAWAVKTTYQLRQTALEGRVCRKCRAFLGPSSSRVRIRDHVRIVTCLGCGAARRKPLYQGPA